MSDDAVCSHRLFVIAMVCMRHCRRCCSTNTASRMRPGWSSQMVVWWWQSKSVAVADFKVLRLLLCPMLQALLLNQPRVLEQPDGSVVVAVHALIALPNIVRPGEPLPLVCTTTLALSSNAMQCSWLSSAQECDSACDVQYAEACRHTPPCTRQLSSTVTVPWSRQSWTGLEGADRAHGEHTSLQSAALNSDLQDRRVNRRCAFSLHWSPQALRCCLYMLVAGAKLPSCRPAAPEYWLKLKRPQAIADVSMDGPSSPHCGAALCSHPS